MRLRASSHLLKDGKLAAFEVQERLYEIGSPDGLRDTAEFLAAGDQHHTIRLHSQRRPRAWRLQDHPILQFRPNERLTDSW
ncbi:MAG TPA: hypothetical protein VNR65_16710 [Geobacterales bacterium]|nr:hypothetical protein [Geobacterales bacterium]